MADFQDPLAQAVPDDQTSEYAGASWFASVADQPYDTFGPPAPDAGYPAVAPPTPALASRAMYPQTSGINEVLATAPPLSSNTAAGYGGGSVDSLPAGSAYRDSRGSTLGYQSHDGSSERHWQSSAGGDPSQQAQVSVTEPEIQQQGGMGKKFVTYALTTQAALPGYPADPTTVRRRFSDFVSLGNLLRVTHRGYFIAPRPDKHVAAGGKLKASFIEKRRLALQSYIRRLAAHRVIGRSEELRVFLTTPDDLQSSVVWASLQPPAPGWLSGALHLFNKVVGRERLVPPPDSAARPARDSHDVVRQVREAVFQFRRNGADESTLPEAELVLRRRSDLVRELASVVATAARAAAAQHRALILRVRDVGEFGLSVGQMGHYEEAHLQVDLGGLQKRLGDGCLQVLEEHSRMMSGVLDALHSRDEALLTLMTLSADLDRQRARAADLQAQGRSAQVQKVMQEVAATEAAKVAAQGEYDRVAGRNLDELNRFVAAQSGEVVAALAAWVRAQRTFAEEESALWVRVAAELGIHEGYLQELERL